MAIQKKSKLITAFSGVLIFLLLQVVLVKEVEGEEEREAVTLEEIIVRGERETDTEECLNIREVREIPARDVGEALKVIEGISSVRKGAIANDIVLRGFMEKQHSFTVI